MNNYHQYLSKFSDEDVIDFEENNLRKIGNVRSLLIWLFENKDGAEKRLREHLNHNELRIREEQGLWFKEGVKCSLLQVGSQKWLKGKIKIRVSVEFYPDRSQETISPLDDYRKENQLDNNGNRSYCQMVNHQYLSKFSDDDVIEFEENNICRVRKIRSLLIWLVENKDGAEKRLREHLKYNGLSIKEEQNSWFKEGVKCSLLQVGNQKWLKGRIKIRVSVEFDSNEAQLPSSILDDIRQTIN